MRMLNAKQITRRFAKNERIESGRHSENRTVPAGQLMQIADGRNGGLKKYEFHSRAPL